MNLKPYYDAALKADEDVKRILAEMDAAFNDGTPEGKQKALDLRPALDEAQTKAKQSNELYASMRDASLVNDNMAALFTAPPDVAPTEEESKKIKVMKRNEFNALSAAGRMTFMKAGGKIEE